MALSLLVLVSLPAIFASAGTTTINANQQITITQTGSPEPAPFTPTLPQLVAPDAFHVAPDGSASISPNYVTLEAIATDSTPDGIPSPASQSLTGSPLADGYLIGAAGAMGDAWHRVQFSVDTDGDGDLDTVEAVLTDSGGNSIVDYVDISIDGPGFGTGSLSDLTAGISDDVRYTVTGSGSQETILVTLGASPFILAFDRVLSTTGNGDFEAGNLTGWTVVVPDGGYAASVASDAGFSNDGNPGSPIVPPGGSRYALLKTDGPGSLTTIARPITVNSLTTTASVNGYAFFNAEDYVPFADSAAVVIRRASSSEVIAVPFASVISAAATCTTETVPTLASVVPVVTVSVPAEDCHIVSNYQYTGWLPWSYTFDETGDFIIEARISNALDSVLDSYMGLDEVTKTGDISGLTGGTFPPGVAISPARAFTGSLEMDTDGDGTRDDLARFVLSDLEGADGTFETLDISTDDAVFGERTDVDDLGDLALGTDNDEILSTGLNSPLTVQIGPYEFLLGLPQVVVESGETGLVIDADVAATGLILDVSSVTVSAFGSWYYDTPASAPFQVTHLGHAGTPCGAGCPVPGADIYALVGRIGSTGPWTYIGAGPVTLTGSGELFLQMNEPDISDNTGELGIDLDFQSFELSSPYLESNTWFSDSFTVDADGDSEADDPIYFVVSDSDSDGKFDSFDLSIGDQVFGEPAEQDDLNENGIPDGLEDALVDFSVSDNSNDERIVVYDPPVTLGTHVFDVAFGPSPIETDPSAESTYYTGSIEATIDGDDVSIPFIFIDTDSDGVFETMNFDSNADGTYGPGESFANGDTVAIGDVSFELSFGGNPADPEFVFEIAPVNQQEEEVDFGTDTGQTPLDRLRLDMEPTPEELRLLEKMEVPPAPRPPASGATIRTIEGQPMVSGEVVVSIDPRHRDKELLVKRIALALGGEVIGAIPQTFTYQVSINADTVALIDRLVAEILSIPGVDSAEPHYLVDNFGARVPDDPLYGRAYADKPYTTSWNLEYINAPQAWDMTVGSPSVNIAVIDADFDYEQTDLRSNAVSIYGNRSSAGGHGTHVAGTACAQGNNHNGVVGLTWECALRMYDFGKSSAVMAQDAMVAAINEGARVINISAQWVDNNKCGTLGTAATKKRVDEINATFAPAIAYAQRQGKDVLWVLAAGNECRDAQYASPASLVQKYSDNIVVVGSIDPDGRLSSFSNFGNIVSIAAPGGQILSTLPRVCNPECQDRYELLSGTSMSAPHVAGVAGLMLSVNPGMTARQLKNCMLQSASRAVPGHSFKVIDAAGSVSCAGGSPVSAPQQAARSGSGPAPIVQPIPTVLPSAGASNLSAGTTSAASSTSNVNVCGTTVENPC